MKGGGGVGNRTIHANRVRSRHAGDTAVRAQAVRHGEARGGQVQAGGDHGVEDPLRHGRGGRHREQEQGRCP